MNYEQRIDEIIDEAQSGIDDDEINYRLRSEAVQAISQLLIEAQTEGYKKGYIDCGIKASKDNQS